MKFLCFSSGSGRHQRKPSDSEALVNGKQPGCIFCDVSVEKGFDILYEDEELIAFRDRWPRAREHILIIPRRHVVSTVPELTPRDVGLRKSAVRFGDGQHNRAVVGDGRVARMRARATMLRPDATKLGFHIPPFSSVHHLHMHVLVPPLTFMGKLQYPVHRGDSGGKGWSWFVTADQAIAILEAGGQIGLRAAPGFKA